MVRLSRQRRALSAGVSPVSWPVAGSRCTWPDRKTRPLDLTACEYGPAAGGPGSAVTVSREWDMGGTYLRNAEPPCLRDLALPAAARREPRGVVPVGPGSLRACPRRRQADPGLHRLRR